MTLRRSAPASRSRRDRDTSRSRIVKAQIASERHRGPRYDPRGPVDLDQYLICGFYVTCKRAENREPDMGERSKQKLVNRQKALALFSSAAAFGVVASPAFLMVSGAEAQTSPTPA